MTGSTSFDVIIVDRDELDYLHSIARDNNVSVEELPRSGLEPITTVALSIAGASFALATVMYLLDKRRGGQVVDLRHGVPKVAYRSQDVVYGLVVVITEDGTVNVTVREPNGMFGQVNELIIGLVSELVGKSAVSVAEVVEKNLPPNSAEVSATLPT